MALGPALVVIGHYDVRQQDYNGSVSCKKCTINNNLKRSLGQRALSFNGKFINMKLMDLVA
jgi:hypothetical protein